MLLCGWRKRKDKRSKSSISSQADESSEPKIDDNASAIATVDPTDDNPTVNFTESTFVPHDLFGLVFILVVHHNSENAVHNHYPLYKRRQSCF